MPVDGLVRRVNDGSIKIPDFQREYVWDLKDASRFIESLLLGLPVPGIFLAEEKESQKRMVIDGQQRLRTLQYFYDGTFKKKEFKLIGVQPEFVGLTYKSLKEEDKRKLDDSIIHATIIKQDQPSEDNSSIYLIFERLNTGGALLKPQEIRDCIYEGPFQKALEELNKNKDWRSLLINDSLKKHKRDEELILRFLALYYDLKNYKKPMEGFLNKFMSSNRNLNRFSIEKISAAFDQTIGFINTHIGERAFRPKKAISAAVFDAVMVGIAKRIETQIQFPEKVKDVYFKLIEHPEFIAASETGTSTKESVSTRINMAIDAFSFIK